MAIVNPPTYRSYDRTVHQAALSLRETQRVVLIRIVSYGVSKNVIYKVMINIYDSYICEIP